MAHFGKFLSLILRHKPETVGVVLDANGWCDVQALLHGLNTNKCPTTMADLEREVEEDSKQRYIFNADKTKIRANQGHSLKVELELTPSLPPNTLYHGTVDRFLSSILTQGLTKQQRQHVHLSATIETATQVGSRRGKPIILKVDAAKMQADGYKFYLSANNVWLTDHVPTQYISHHV